MEMTFRELQEAQIAWVEHNFPEQVEDVTVEDVQMLLEPCPTDEDRAESIVRHIRNGHLVKRDYHGFLGMVEELGELAHAYLKQEQGIRMRCKDCNGRKWIVTNVVGEDLDEPSYSDIDAVLCPACRGSGEADAGNLMGDAMADLIIFMCSFCNTHGFDLQQEIEKAWQEVSQRDWQKYPKNGVTE